MIKAILIDDEVSALNALQKDLEDYCSSDITIVAKCQGPVEGLKALKKWKPDLVFLDIMMPGMNGFELLEVLGDIEFDVVFVTAYDTYALDAFNISAVHYLIKPIDSEKLIAAVERVKEKYYGTFSKSHLSMVMENMQPYNPNKKLGLSTARGLEFVKVQDIMYCQADKGYVSVHCESQQKPILVARALKDFERMLHSDDFFRIHAGYLISRKYLEIYVLKDGGYVVMSDGKSMSVARAKKKAFRRWLELHE